MSTGPSHPVLPRRVDPLRFAQQGVKLEAQIPALTLVRLVAAVHKASHPVQATIQFAVDEAGFRVLRGSLSAQVEVICQRCLEPMALVLQAGINLAVVINEEQIKHLPKTLDPWLIEGELDQADLYEVLEEELLLSLPIVASHQQVCVDEQAFQIATTEATENAEEDDNPEAGRDNPFKILEQLKVKLTAKD